MCCILSNFKLIAISTLHLRNEILSLTLINNEFNINLLCWLLVYLARMLHFLSVKIIVYKILFLFLLVWVTQLLWPTWMWLPRISCQRVGGYRDKSQWHGQYSLRKRRYMSWISVLWEFFSISRTWTSTLYIREITFKHFTFISWYIVYSIIFQKRWKSSYMIYYILLFLPGIPREPIFFLN